MRTKPLITLLTAGVALGAIAWWTSLDPAASRETGRRLLPVFPVNDIDEIVITDGVVTARVTRVDNTWRLPGQHGYPARFETVRALLVKLDDLRIGQTLAANSRQRERMGVAPDQGITATLFAGGNPVAVLQLGAFRHRETDSSNMPFARDSFPDGRFVAVQNDPDVYLIADTFSDISADPLHWLDRTLLDVRSDTVQAITIENPEDGVFTLVRDDGGKLRFKDNDISFDDDKSFSLLNMLSWFTLQSVADPALDDEALGLADPRLFSVLTRDGTRYSLEVGAPLDDGADRHVRITVGFESSGESGSDAEMASAAAEGARQLNARLAPWTLRIPAHKASALAPSRQSLIKATEPPPEAATPSPTALNPSTDEPVKEAHDH